jgi:hypothetical protein
MRCFKRGWLSLSSRDFHLGAADQTPYTRTRSPQILSSHVLLAPNPRQLRPSRCPNRQERFVPITSSRHLSTPTPLPSPDALGSLSCRQGQRPDPPQHVAEQPPVEMALCQEQPVVAGMLDEPSAGLHEPLLQTRQRLAFDPLRQADSAPEVAQVIRRNVGSAARRSASLRSS